MSALKFLTGSEANSINLFSFDPIAKSIKPVGQTALKTATWIEPSSVSSLKGKVFYAVSEEGGEVLSLELGADGKAEITGRAPTGGNPAHIHALRDGSGIVATNYMGGSAAFFPVDKSSGRLDPPSNLISELGQAVPLAVKAVLPQSLQPIPPTPLLKFKFPYQTTGPNSERQEDSHPHQCIEDKKGNLYVPDLGSDKIWIVRREGEFGLAVKGELQLPAGAGPRHAVISPDDHHLYVIAELSHRVFTFIIPEPISATPIQPLDAAGSLIVPPAVPKSLYKKMTAGELVLSPISPRTIYASNRGQCDLILEPQVADTVKGDSVAIVSLNDAGDKVESVKWLETGVNFIRGMCVSADGKYIGVAGQKDGNLEIYEAGGEHGEKLTLVAESKNGASGASAMTDFVFI